MRTEYKETDGEVSAVCTTRNFAYACWLLHDFSNQCRGIILDDGPNVSQSDRICTTRFYVTRGLTKKGNYRFISELTVHTQRMASNNKTELP